MKKLNSTIRKTKEGSALLIAVLVMGILLTLTLGLSDLVIREIRQTTDVVSAGKAYFAAEAGVENALLDLHNNLPGYQTRDLADAQNDYVQVGDDPANLNAQYRILNKASTVPSFDPDKPITVPGSDIPTNVNFVYASAPEATYKDLPLNQSAIIPLYSATGDASNPYENVSNFLIEYYVDYSAYSDDVVVKSKDLINLDVLRWKIFGRPQDQTADSQNLTDAISDFFPASKDASAATPMCIGTDQTLQPNGENQGCLFPIFSGDDTAGSTADAHSWSAARECYLSDSSTIQGQLNGVQTNCDIKDFIAHHNQNYVVLTNAINPDVLLPGQDLTSPEAKAKFTIHYRIIAAPGPGVDDTGAPQLVREAAAISSDGFAAAGQVKQTIDVNINQSSFLPVFNFSLYHTCTKADQSQCAPK